MPIASEAIVVASLSAPPIGAFPVAGILFLAALAGGLSFALFKWVVPPPRKKPRALKPVAGTRPLAPALSDCVVLGGHSNALKTGATYNVHFTAEAITAQAEDGTLVEFRYDRMRSVELTGGAAVSGGGFVSGGFGLQSAVEGMIVASTLNKLTKRTKVWTLVWLRPVGAEAIFFDGFHSPEQLRIMLSPVLGAIEEKSPVGQPRKDPADLASQLERITQLKREGVLTDAEFETAKQRLLNGSTGAAGS